MISTGKVLARGMETRMLDAETEATGCLLVKTRKICRFISYAMVAVFGVLCIWWLVSIGVMICSLLNPGFSDNPVNGLTLVNYVLCGIAMAAICVTLIRVFSDTSKGQSPFTMLHVRRLRLVAIALLAYAVLEFGMTCSATFMKQGWMDASVGGASPTLNLFPLVAAAVVFAFSFVFKYGVLLQKFSDETL